MVRSPSDRRETRSGGRRCSGSSQDQRSSAYSGGLKGHREDQQQAQVRYQAPVKLAHSGSRPHSDRAQEIRCSPNKEAATEGPRNRFRRANNFGVAWRESNIYACRLTQSNDFLSGFSGFAALLAVLHPTARNLRLDGFDGSGCGPAWWACDWWKGFTWGLGEDLGTSSPRSSR